MWIISQIGAREHYAIPRALHREGQLGLLCTDVWIRPGSPWGHLPGTRRMRDRWHRELEDAEVYAPNVPILGFEVRQRIRKHHSSEVIIARNTFYQDLVVRHLSRRFPAGKEAGNPPTLFSYSCAALELFRFAKSRGWHTVLGQIDPGPEEERLVAAEFARYPALKNAWQPSPPVYWERWHEEVELADRIIVNSEWSRQCLLKEGVPEEKMEIVPLTVGGGRWAVGGGLEAVGGGQSERSGDGRSEAKSIGGEQSERSGDGRSEAKSIGGGPEAVGDKRLSVSGEPETKNEKLRTKNKEQSTKHKEQSTTSLLFLGQINLRKGVGRLLDAMRLLKDEPITLTLAGPAEIEPSAWADLPKVRWVGTVPRSEVGRYYEAADLFILPTISDGYALTQLEALARGLPVLASKSCGAAVTHGENGWILEDLEPATIARAILDAREALPLANVEMPAFGLDDLAGSLLGGVASVARRAKDGLR